MSGLVSSDPLALLSIEAGLIRPPLADAAAEGDSTLDAPQRAAVIGQPVPIVFCRRDETAGTGGVLVSPPATEARFSNDASNAVTASYHLILSEGRIGSIQVRDVFQRSCRVGTHTQTYDRRAGSWTPGNYITPQPGYDMPECPYYCGTVGVYTGMSTLSFTVTIPNGFDLWNRQVHAFIRNGMEVPRLIGGDVASSNNFADFYLWSLRNAIRLPDDQIDLDGLRTVAQFLAVNGLNCDMQINESRNLSDLLASMVPYFLLSETRVNGRRGLRTLVPINSNGTIRTTAVPWVATFTEDQILAFEMTMEPPADRRPFCVQAIWRQQLTDDVGIIRTSEVRYQGEAETGPYEQHDLSAFCTRESHAVKAAAYVRARRRHVTHAAQVRCSAVGFPPELRPGDVVRVTLQRTTSDGHGLHDFLYQVDRIGMSAEGEATLALVHLPIDANGASLVAIEVAAATGTGIMLSSNRTGVSCDVNSSSDTTIPAESYQEGTPDDDQVITPTPDPEAPPPADPEADPECVGAEVQLVFESVKWQGNELVITLAINPSGTPPRAPHGPLEATIKNGEVKAYGEAGLLQTYYEYDGEGNVTSSYVLDVNNNQITLPTLDVTETIAPVIVGPVQRDYVWRKEIRVAYQGSDFPQLGSGIREFYMPIRISDTDGGYCDVNAESTGWASFKKSVPFLAVINSNAAKDDNFKLYLGGNLLGTLDLGANDFTTYLFVWSRENEDIEIIQKTLLNVFNTPLVFADSKLQAGDPPTPGTAYAIKMENIKENNNGNYGALVAGYGQRSIDTFATTYYDPPDGEDYVNAVTWGDP